MSKSLSKTGPTTIAIVGAGFSGTATALSLLSQLATESASGPTATQVKIYLIDKACGFGKGLAYATEDDNLVLNVPCGNMSVYLDRPDDFLEYCNELDSSLNSGTFMFRRVYGEYLQARLNQAKAAHPDALVEVRDVVSAISHDQQFTVTLASGTQLTVDKVVLALGHFPPRSLAQSFGAPEQANCVDNPWDICAVDRLPLDKDALIVGTGHTAIDTLFRLVSTPAPRKIYLVSRHGHTPNGHRKAGEFVKLASLSYEVETTVRSLLNQIAPATPTIRALFAAVRQLTAQHGERQGNWRDVINSLRHVTPEIWMALPAKERARFLRHVVYHWDVLRHRLAPVAIRRLQSLIDAGRVEIIAGRITGISSDLQVEIQLRGSGLQRSLQVGSVVNCTGPNYDIHRTNNVLLRQLAKAGWLQQDEVKIGFQVDEQYRCSELSHLHYIGPMLKARYWEAIAVPELRMHAANLAKILLLEV